MNYATLKSEIVNDPSGLGYATAYTAGADADVAAILNATRQTINIDRAWIEPWEIVNAIVPTEASALQAAGRDALLMLLQLSRFPTNKSGIKLWFTTLFPSGTTFNNLAALMSRKGSRAEELFGVDVQISPSDIALARKA